MVHVFVDVQNIVDGSKKLQVSPQPSQQIQGNNRVIEEAINLNEDDKIQATNGSAISLDLYITIPKLAKGFILNVSPSSLTKKGPNSDKKPSKLLHPGPPFIHKSKGSLDGLDCDSTNLKEHVNTSVLRSNKKDFYIM
uniref:Uncharacterized protein n=1 Tax=Romanomermis culicivorax TaxID=13658 RepID=A0A915L6Q7_ROMCU